MINIILPFEKYYKKSLFLPLKIDSLFLFWRLQLD